MGDSLKVWYIAFRFSCCCDKPWPSITVLSWKVFISVNQSMMPLSTDLQPWDWQSFIMCLLLKQLMHNLLSLTTLYFSSFDSCLNVQHCDTVCESLQTSHIGLTLTYDCDISSPAYLSLFALVLVDALSSALYRCSRRVYSCCMVGHFLLEIWISHSFFCFVIQFLY